MSEKDIKKNEITESFTYDYSDKFNIEDLENRRLYINTEIDETVLETIGYHILRYNRLDKDISANQRKPIIVYINSPGGSVVDGYGLIDLISHSTTDVYTVNLAACYSMAFFIFLAGKKRYAMPHSQFLLHEGFVGGADNLSKMRDRMEFETVELEEENKKYILSKTKIDEETYKKKFRCEWYMLPQKAKEIGVADYIIGEDCTIDEII